VLRICIWYSLELVQFWINGASEVPQLPSKNHSLTPIPGLPSGKSIKTSKLSWVKESNIANSKMWIEGKY
jgi:hypothetical protein